ncbi:hypothetical protein TWF730_005646 [Orbilia blumenaviensis]|uniref:Altered inheritance of mitochondria protein 41 n=1 Tax=Orbilia blumenaviensis TaxID=1796055 RepID=A0AAV9VQ58_9PEZI
MFASRVSLVPRLFSRQLVRAYSEPAAPFLPPLLLALRKDLKNAMKSRDKEKLNVVKAILAEITNAAMAQPPRPVANDMDILKILQSMEKKHNVAIESFKSAQRQDLVDKEQLQLDIVKGYSGQVDVMSPEKVTQVVEEIVASYKQKDVALDMGSLMRDAKARIAELGGQASSSDIATAARQAVAANKPSR